MIPELAKMSQYLCPSFKLLTSAITLPSLLYKRLPTITATFLAEKMIRTLATIALQVLELPTESSEET